jgi:hypothetical protein
MNIALAEGEIKDPETRAIIKGYVSCMNKWVPFLPLQGEMFLEYNENYLLNPDLENDGFEWTTPFLIEANECFFDTIRKQGVSHCYYFGVLPLNWLWKYRLSDRELFKLAKTVNPLEVCHFADCEGHQKFIEDMLHEYFRKAHDEYFETEQISDDTKIMVWKWFWVCKFFRIFRENKYSKYLMNYPTKVETCDLNDTFTAIYDKDGTIVQAKNKPTPTSINFSFLVRTKISWSTFINFLPFPKFHLSSPSHFPLETVFISSLMNIPTESSPRKYILPLARLACTPTVRGYFTYAHPSNGSAFLIIPRILNPWMQCRDFALFMHREDFVEKGRSWVEVMQERKVIMAKVYEYVSRGEVEWKAVGVEVEEGEWVGEKMWVEKIDMEVADVLGVRMENREDEYSHF